MSLTIRKGSDSVMDQIYMMGFDAWSDGASEEDYLNGCRNSEKYKKGTWYILLDGPQMVSSLIVYNFGETEFGIGSISTPVNLRNRGFASKLIFEVIAEIESEFKKPIFFLYSDISPEFYRRFGFNKISKSAQKYDHSVCMVRGKSSLTTIPEYF
jgi:predicted acetyltransferase